VSNDKRAAAGFPALPEQPRTHAQTQEWQERWEAAKAAPVQYLSEIHASATGWYTIPKAVRLAVWVWAITVLLGVTASLFGVALWVITAGAVLSQM
jgi:hypothetical protein